jgi:hypothetical protein
MQHKLGESSESITSQRKQFNSAKAFSSQQKQLKSAKAAFKAAHAHAGSIPAKYSTS